MEKVNYIGVIPIELQQQNYERRESEERSSDAFWGTMDVNDLLAGAGLVENIRTVCDSEL